MSGSSIFTFLQKAVGHFNSLLFFIRLLMKTRSKVAVAEACLNVSMMATLLRMQDFWKSFSGQTTAAHCTSNYCPAKVTEGYSKRLVVSCIQIHIGETALFHYYTFPFLGSHIPISNKDILIQQNKNVSFYKIHIGSAAAAAARVGFYWHEE